MLTGQEILKLIHNRHLTVEPLLDRYQIGACSLDIRVGTHIQYGSSKSIHRLKLGESVIIKPGDYLRFVILETLSFPSDISGIVFLWSGFQSIGLLMPPTRIDPGWRGKLVLGVFNFSPNSIQLSVGQRVASVSLFKLASETPTSYQNSEMNTSRMLDLFIDEGVLSPELHYDRNANIYSRNYRTGELEGLTKANTDLKEGILDVGEGTEDSFRSLACRTFEEKDIQRKGRLLEDLMENLLSQIRGLKIIKRNARLKAEEIDIIVQNNVDNTFWKTLGSPLVVECKNWSSKVGSDEIGNLAVKMTTLSPDVKTGILVAVNGISGDSYRDAQLRRREYRQKGIYIIVIERDDLERVVAGQPISQIIEEKYNELYLI